MIHSGAPAVSATLKPVRASSLFSLVMFSQLHAKKVLSVGTAPPKQSNHRLIFCYEMWISLANLQRTFHHVLHSGKSHVKQFLYHFITTAEIDCFKQLLNLTFKYQTGALILFPDILLLCLVQWVAWQLYLSTVSNSTRFFLPSSIFPACCFWF